MLFKNHLKLLFCIVFSSVKGKQKRPLAVQIIFYSTNKTQGIGDRWFMDFNLPLFG